MGGGYPASFASFSVGWNGLLGSGPVGAESRRPLELRAWLGSTTASSPWGMGQRRYLWGQQVNFQS